MARFHGCVKMYFMKEGHGFITELGETGSLDKDNVVTERDIYFRARDLELADSTVLAKATSGEILEYERVMDDQGRYRAYNITGLYGTPVQCSHGLIVFKRYADVHREALRREGTRAIEQYLSNQSAPRKRGRGRGGGGGGGGGSRGHGRGGGRGGRRSEHQESRRRTPSASPERHNVDDDELYEETYDHTAPVHDE